MQSRSRGWFASAIVPGILEVLDREEQRADEADSPAYAVPCVHL